MSGLLWAWGAWPVGSLRLQRWVPFHAYRHTPIRKHLNESSGLRAAKNLPGPPHMGCTCSWHASQCRDFALLCSPQTLWALGHCPISGPGGLGLQVPGAQSQRRLSRILLPWQGHPGDTWQEPPSPTLHLSGDAYGPSQALRAQVQASGARLPPVALQAACRPRGGRVRARALSCPSWGCAAWVGRGVLIQTAQAATWPGVARSPHSISLHPHGPCFSQSPALSRPSLLPRAHTPGSSQRLAQGGSSFECPTANPESEHKFIWEMGGPPRGVRGQGWGRASAEALLGPWAEILAGLAGSENTASDSCYRRQELARVSPNLRGSFPPCQLFSDLNRSDASLGSPRDAGHSKESWGLGVRGRPQPCSGTGRV